MMAGLFKIRAAMQTFLLNLVFEYDKNLTLNVRAPS